MVLVQCPQQLADGRSQLGHRVLGGDGVIDRRRVEHPHPVAQQSRLDGRRPGVFEQPPTPDRGPQPVAHPHQHGGVERHIADVHACRRLPGQVSFQPIAGLTVGEALMRLEHHHRGQHPGRHGGPAPDRARVAIGEVVVRKDRFAVVGQQAVDPPQALTEQFPRALEAFLRRHRSQGHP